MAIKDARSPVCAGAGLAGPIHARSAGRCSLSHPNIVAVFDSGSEAGMHDLVRSRGSTIRGGRTSIEVSLEYNPPGGKAGELVAELVKDPDKQVRRAVDGFRQAVERGGLVGG
jgi:hypothetical protein